MYHYNDYELLYLIAEHDEIALDIMYSKYTPLIKARIYGFRIKPYNQEDFFQEGLWMLFRAIQTYRPNSRKTFNKYFDLILQRHFIHLLRKESKHFYNVELIENVDFIKEEKEAKPDLDLDLLISLCKFSKFEMQVLELQRQNYSSKEIANHIDCQIKQVYDATDRIKRKMKGAKNSLDNKG
ncbi:MAG: sigma-70 family RNA polymerase sigma factor [Bacilli bacterium]|nr:sigma-70 family RNA polymerase sigma factor [Bacilli bacterium]